MELDVASPGRRVPEACDGAVDIRPGAGVCKDYGKSVRPPGLSVVRQLDQVPDCPVEVRVRVSADFARADRAALCIRPVLADLLVPGDPGNVPVS